MSEIAKLLLAAEELLMSSYEAVYHDYSGLAPAGRGTADDAALSDRLLRREAFEMLAEAADATADPIEARSLTQLRAFLIREALERAADAERLEVARASCERRIESPTGDLVSLREAQAMLPLIGDRTLRDPLDRRIAHRVGQFEPLLARGLERLLDASMRVCREEYLPLLESLSGFDLAALVAEARSFLAETEDAYREIGAWFLDRVCGVALRDARLHDWLYLLRAPWLRSQFQAFNLASKASDCLREMGFDWPKGLRLDLEERPNKVARAFCVPLSVPDRVVLSIYPRGGFEDYAAFYHELGHALHYSHVSRFLPLGVRVLGDDALFEGYAMLFERLVNEPLWLKRFLGFSVEPDDRRFFALRRLFHVRRSCAKLLFEVELYRQGPRPDRGDWYAETLGRALAIEVHREFALLDIDPHLYCSAYLRAWALEDALRAYLLDRWDEQWWRDRASGAFLRGAFSRGQIGGAADFAAELGAELSLARVSKTLLAQLGG